MAASAQPELDEYQVKAAFLYNFTKFVEWPPQAFDVAATPIIVCVVGETPIYALLESAVVDKTAGKRSLAVRKVSEAQQATGCHILFIARADRKRIPAVLAAITPWGILTVGETPEFVAEGGVVNFKLENGRVRFEISVDAARREKLRISSKLLNLAEIVKTEGPR
jgi:YfiR/HmsC-like